MKPMILFALGGIFHCILTLVVQAAEVEVVAQPDVANHATSKRAWRVGYAEADITPSPGHAMMAGFGRERYAHGSVAPLRAQALALRDQNDKTAVLIVADVLGFDRVSVDSLRRKIYAEHGCPAQTVCFSASHTHWGPAISFRTNFAIGGPNVWYIAKLEQTLLELVDEAIGDLASAGISYGSCEVRIGMCRRLPNEQGEFKWGANPDGSYDEHTPVLKIVRQRSPKQIVLVGHACHPTSTGIIGKWSPDYPGAMRQKLETTLEDCRAMFVMGCGGDAKVVFHDESTGKDTFAAHPQQSHAAGSKLANYVLKYLKKDNLSELAPDLCTTLVHGSLTFQEPRCREEIERMSFTGSHRSSKTWWARQSLTYPDRRRQQHYEVQVWCLGDLTMVALEGEVCADWGAMTRALATTRHAMVIGYANHCPGYIPTARIIREGGYEGDTSHMAYFLPAPFQPKIEVELSQLLLKALGRSNQDQAKTPPIYKDKTHLLKYLDETGHSHEITRAEQWKTRQAHILADVQSVLGPVPGRSFRVPLDLQVIEEVNLDSYSRKKIAYNVDPYDRVESYLLIPHNLKGNTPAILALHGTNPRGKDKSVGLWGKPRSFYGKELAERGYIVLAPDYWPMGHYHDKTSYNPYQKGYASGVMKGIWNHMRAIDVLQSLPEVDDDRIGSIGLSLGGYNTVFLAAFEPRVKAMVSCAGYNSFFDYAASEYGGGDLKNWSLDKHMRRIRTVYDDDPQQVPFDFPELIGVLAPRPFLTIAPTMDQYFALSGVRKCINAARPVYELLDAGENFQVDFPDATHDFPDAQRQKAYEFFDQVFNHQ